MNFNSIEIAEGASLDLLMVYSKNGASVNGSVRLPQDQPVKLMQPEAKKIELHEKESLAINLPLIPKDETDRVRRQLGI